YPQMTVEKNLSFGLRVAGMPRPEVASRVKRASEILQIEPLLQRKPAELSGGQRQRVAIGRALVRDVDVFLFDEPLSNLDAKLRSDLRVEIKRLHQRLKNTMIYVTHDQIEALTLADRIAVMKNGVIQQLADPHTIYNRPVNLYVAGFIGSPQMNMLSGTLNADDNTIVTDDGTVIPVGTYAFDKPIAGSTKVVLGVRPEHIQINEDAKGLPFTAEVEVEIVEPMGSDTLAWTTIAGKAITFRCDSDVIIKTGQKLVVGFDPARGSIFNAESTDRI
ncbi:MAG: ATP-binding cassette domain-containing protein, partial [Devosia sp.]